MLFELDARLYTLVRCETGRLHQGLPGVELYLRPAESLEEAQLVRFCCPLCPNRHPVITHFSERKVPLSDDNLFGVRGHDLRDLTLDCSVRLEPCKAHFRIYDGRVWLEEQ